MIAGEAPEILDPRDNTGLAPGFDRVARMVTIKNRHWERSNGKSCRPLQKSENAEAFDRHYSSVHIPLAKKIPGLKKYDISTGAVGAPTGPSGIHLVATLYFDSADALKAGRGAGGGWGSRQFCGWRRGALFFRYERSLRPLGEPSADLDRKESWGGRGPSDPVGGSGCTLQSKKPRPRTRSSNPARWTPAAARSKTVLLEPGRSPRCGLFARRAGVHVDFHAYRHFNNLRSFPGHTFLPGLRRDVAPERRLRPPRI